MKAVPLLGVQSLDLPGGVFQGEFQGELQVLTELWRSAGWR